MTHNEELAHFLSEHLSRFSIQARYLLSDEYVYVDINELKKIINEFLDKRRNEVI